MTHVCLCAVPQAPSITGPDTSPHQELLQEPHWLSTDSSSLRTLQPNYPLWDHNTLLLMFVNKVTKAPLSLTHYIDCMETLNSLLS